jgi:predicted transposase YdaD
MESFDESLKYLLHEEPADFLRFGFADPALTIVGPCETDLPSRGRDIDGSYFVLQNGVQVIAHIEFHRRHQSLEELAIDVAEAQIRLYRRERCPVVSHVWDLYGDRAGPLMKPRRLAIGPGSHSTYVRINLRAMTWRKLLAKAPPTLWPLVPLTRDGATEIAVKTARDAITSEHDQNSIRQADHLAVLWFVAEAEDVPTQIVKSYIREAQLMESALYKSIFAQGESRGESRGEARVYAKTINKLLLRWLGTVDSSLRQRVATFPDRNILAAWHDEALELNDAESARKLLEKIQNTPSPSGSSQAA